MQSNKLTFSLTSFILILLLSFIQASAVADHGGFTATLSAIDVVDDGNPNSIEVESREANTSLTADHDKDIEVFIRFDKAAELPVAADFTIYLFDKNDELIEYIGDIKITLTITIEEINKKNYELTIPASNAGAPNIPTPATTIILILKKGTVKSVERTDIEAGSVPTNEEATITLNLVRKEPKFPDYIPKVVSITRYDSRGFIIPNITGPFTVKIVLTEKPRAFTPEHIGVTNGKATAIVAGTLDPEFDTDPKPTGRDGKYHLYYVTITPDFKSTDDIVIQVNVFEDTVKPPNRYIPSQFLVEGQTKLTVRVSPSATLKPKPPGFSVALPHNDNASIPANGFYILTKNSENSGIDIPPVEEGPIHRRPTQLSYNVRENSELPNLETFLLNAGTIDLVGPVHVPAGSVIISEIMWGRDQSLADTTESQWIELYNTTGTSIPIDKDTWFFQFYEVNEPVPYSMKYGIIDRISTVDPASHADAVRNWWSIVGKGQSGRTGVRPIQVPISMERLIFTTGEAADGTKGNSWLAATPPSLNFDLTKRIIGIGTPGAIRLTSIPKPVSPPDPITFPAEKPNIAISEIMYAVGNSQLPQWIELHNRGNQQVNLHGWNVTIENAPEDPSVLKTSLSLTLGETPVGAGQAVLLVTEQGRHSGIGHNSGDLRLERVVVLRQLLRTQAIRYRLLSNIAFKITLTPPSNDIRGDTAGNLGAAPRWELPTIEGESRSSIIRNYGDPENRGTMANGWLLAAEQTFLYAQHNTYYGHSSDQSTPGYRSGNPLPVVLSRFRPERDKATGTVIITWTTESELNNAGFNLLRSEQRDAVFAPINPALISGAGTSSEKHTYRFTDTTAKPNVAYYYQIEDVSFAGARQTLATVRLKGHLSASGKLPIPWGELKVLD